VALGDPLREGVDGTEHVLRSQVPEHERADFGTGLAEGPFQAGDYLKLTFTGMLNKKATGTKEVALIDGTSYLKEWTTVDLSDLGKIDELGLHLSSSRADFPLYCCLDDMGYHYIEIYE
jgi:hypothetical protein